MPNTRWWAFEDGRTNFGDVDAATDRSRQAAVPRVRARLRRTTGSSSRSTLPGGSRRRGARARGHERLRRADLDRAGRHRRRRRLAALEHVHGQRRGRAATRRRHQPAAAAHGARRCRRATARGGPARSATRWRTWSGAIERTIPLPTASAKPRRRGGGARRSPFSSGWSPTRAGAGASRRPSRDVRYEVDALACPSTGSRSCPCTSPGERPRDPAAARGAAAHHRGRSRDRRSRAPADRRCCATASTRRARAVLRARGGGPARRRRRSPRAASARAGAAAAVSLGGARKATGRGEGSSGLAFDRLVDVPPEDA